MRKRTEPNPMMNDATTACHQSGCSSPRALFAHTPHTSEQTNPERTAERVSAVEISSRCTSASTPE